MGVSLEVCSIQVVRNKRHPRCPELLTSVLTAASGAPFTQKILKKFPCSLVSKAPENKHLRNPGRHKHRYPDIVLAMQPYEGHEVVGSIFMIWAMWMAGINAMKLFNRKPTTSPPKLLRPQFVENVVCTITAFIGMLIQQFAPGYPGMLLYDEKNHQWVDIKSWHHSTMFLFFWVSSIVGALTHSPLRIPLGFDRLLLSLAEFNTGMLIYFHHPAAVVTPLVLRIHTLLLIPIFSAAVCLLLEVHFRDHPILAFFRTSMFMTQGTWFWQIRLVLHPTWGAPIWDENDPGALLFFPMCFSWHYLVNIFLLSIIYGTVYCFLNRKRKYKGTNTEMEPLKQDCEAYTVLPNERTEG